MKYLDRLLNRKPTSNNTTNEGSAPATTPRSQNGSEPVIGTPWALIAHVDSLPSFRKQRVFMLEYRKMHEESLDVWYKDVNFQAGMREVVKPKVLPDGTTDFMVAGEVSENNPRMSSGGGSGLMSVREYDSQAHRRSVERQQHKQPDVGRSRF